jgi:hypothetical protein
MENDCSYLKTVVVFFGKNRNCLFFIDKTIMFYSDKKGDFEFIFTLGL